MLNHVFAAVVSMQAMVCYVIVLLLLLRFFLRKQPKSYSYALWSVVLFRLLCPFSIPSPWSLIPQQAKPLADMEGVVQAVEREGQMATLVTLPSAANTAGEQLVGSATSSAELLNPTFWQRVVGVLPLLWLLGLLFLLAASLWQLWQLRTKLKQAELREIQPAVFCVQGLETAFVLGLWKAKIYLPQGLSPQEQDYVLLHERTHLRRKDHWWKLLGFVALCIHWFNPLVWLAFLLACRDMEMSCDEAVIRRKGGEIKKSYASSLLTFAAKGGVPKGIPLAFGEGDTKVRIQNILRYQKPRLWVTVLLILLLFPVAYGLVSDPMESTTAMTREEADAWLRQVFPEPYIVEEQGRQDVLGDSGKEWLYQLSMPVEESVSKTESQWVERPLYSLALDGRTASLWLYDEEAQQWQWQEERWEPDYAALWQDRSDNMLQEQSKVADLASRLPYPEGVQYEGVQIEEKEGVPTLNIRLTADEEERLQQIGSEVSQRWTRILRTLIGDLAQVNYEFSVSDSSGHYSIGTSIHDHSSYESCQGVEDFQNQMQTAETQLRQARAESVQEQLNELERQKRAAWYLDWPQSVEVKSVTYGVDGYTLQSSFTLSSLPTGEEAQHLLRRNAAAWMEAFSAEELCYRSEQGEELWYRRSNLAGETLSEEEQAAIKEQTRLLQSVAESRWTMNPTAVVFPAYEESNGYNDAVMGVEPFEVALQLPQGWSIKSGAPLDGRYAAAGAWTVLEIYDDSGHKVGGMGYNLFDDGAEQEENPMAIYNQVALANHYAFLCREPDYQLWAETEQGKTALTTVYLSQMMSETLGFGSQERKHYGILSYDRDRNVYVAVELDSSVERSQVQEIAESLAFQAHSPETENGLVE